MRGSQSTGLSPVQPSVAAVLCLVLLLFADDAWASYGMSSVGSPTLPPSSYEGGLVTNPNPLDNSSNSIITGNVRGGKHFRGPIPYDASTSFQAPLGSTRLDSFLRYSAVPEELGVYSPGYETFYSPTGTTSKIRPGQGGVFAPTSPRVAGGIAQWRADQPSDVVDLGDIRQSRVSVGETATATDGSQDSLGRYGNWPLSGTPGQTRQGLSDELGRQFADDRAPLQNSQPITPEEYQLQMEQFRQQLEKVKAGASKLEQSMTTGDALSKDASQQAPSDPAGLAAVRKALEGASAPLPQPPDTERSGDSELVLLRPGPLIPGTPTVDRQTQTPGSTDIPGLITPPAGARGSATAESRPPSAAAQSGPGRLTEDAATRTNRIAGLFLTQGPGGPGQSQMNSAGELPALQRIKEAAGALEKPYGSTPRVTTNAAGDTSLPPDRLASLMEQLRSTSGEIDALERADVNKPAAAEMKPTDNHTPAKYQSLTPASQEKFDRYLKMAEMHLQQGRYYRAVESFSLASVYNPNDRRVHIGRSHALFAAGEYVSSATFLAKAIELDPGQTLAKLDLVNATGGPDLFLRRITDLEQCSVKTGTPDLQLLLAYIYYQMDRPDEARTAIEAAEKGVGHLSAVDLLRDAITK